MSLHLEQSYASLPDRFFHRAKLTPVKAPTLICLNERLGVELGLDLDYLKTPVGIALLAGSHRPQGIEPIALAYAGHQFGHFVPQLGDGRALLLGEVIDTKGKPHDLQLKGSGPTIFSRTGDGRAALGPVLREYLISEAMAALDIPTTRSLATVQTGETVLRDKPLPGAILARVASSHIRIGTFQYFSVRGDVEALRLLSQFVIQRHYPGALTSVSPYLALLESVLAAQATLIAKWMSVGFIHGVMNTDNMSIAGETIDYGPCAFMDSFDPATCFSSIDRDGRYAYGHQPAIALWNLTRFAETLLPLLSENIDDATMIAEKALLLFEPLYAEASKSLMRGKIGLEVAEEGDADLIKDLLEVMALHKADFTLTFRALGQAMMEEKGVSAMKSLVKNPDAFEPWLLKWRQRLSREPQSPSQKRDRMNKINPLYIPRNHQVEAVLDTAINNQDFGPFNKLLHVLENPFSEKQRYSSYAAAPEPRERLYQTFCGT